MLISNLSGANGSEAEFPTYQNDIISSLQGFLTMQIITNRFSVVILPAE